MKALNQFSIPIEGLKRGIHEKVFSIGNDFFDCFENSPIKKGKYEVKMILDKRSDFIQLDFDIKGSFETICDRCTADIHFPVDDEYQLLIKYADTTYEELNVLYITRDTHHVNISKFLYDSLCLSIPISKVYDCRIEPPFPCDEAVIERLEHLESPIEPISEKKENTIWDSLNKLKLGNN